MTAIRLPVPEQWDPIVRVRAVRDWLGNAEGRRHRRVSVSSDGGRAHIEVRGAHRPERAALVHDVREALERLEGVDWAEVDAVVGRAVVVFDPGSIEPDDLIDAIETVEEMHDAGEERFPHDRPDHPADTEPIQRNVFAIVADVVGIGFATAVQVVRVVPIPAEIPGVISLVDSQPRVRRFLENRLGRPTTDFVLVSANAFTQALGQGPIGLMVDVTHRMGSLGEMQSRRAVWYRRESELVIGRSSVARDAFDFPARPVALPNGPIERYANQAAVGSLGAVALALGVTRNPRRSADLLLTGIPKAATMGRESFAALLGRELAGRGVIAMDPAALRRLDRVDTIVLEARVLTSSSWLLDTITPFAVDADPVRCTLRARRLFDPRDVGATRVDGAWTLGPIGDRVLPRGGVTRARRLRSGGHRVLGLWRGDELQAFVSAVEEPVSLAREVVAAADEADLDVFLAGGSDAFAAALGIGQERLAVTELVDEVRALQRSGRVVLLVAGHDPGPLRAADLGLGVEVDGDPAPFAAHLVVGPGLANVWRIVRAVSDARSVSSRSARWALAGASTGGVWAFAGPGGSAARRTLLPVNVSALAAIGFGGLAGMHAGSRTAPRPGPRHRWHEIESDAALDLLAVTLAGLDPDEQARRRGRSTARVVREPVGLARAAFEELANPLTPLLAIGAALSAAVGSATDAVLVGGVVGVNALVGAGQRMRTERSLVQLEAASDAPVRVRIEGTIEALPADHLVPGDVIELEAGEGVPADCRILECVSCEADESAITGESLPVTKGTAATPGAPTAERTSMLFEGSVIVTGTAVALVVAIGADTEAGRSMAASAGPPPSGVERRLGTLTRVTLPVTIAAGAAVTGLGFLYRRPARDAIGAGVALTVAAVPEGLPVLATLAQVAASRRLARRNALVRNPRALEALGRVDQVCFDKTGTLTHGSISLAAVSDGEHAEDPTALDAHGLRVLAAAVRASPVPNGAGSLPHATDQAIVEGAALAGVGDTHGMRAWERTEELPFEASRGFHATLGRADGDTTMVTVKGAPEVVLPRASTWRRGDRVVPLDAASLRVLEDHVEALGRTGLRVLAVAEAPASDAASITDDAALDGVELLGFVGLADLVRPAAAGALRDLEAAGVRVAMITGDHPSTAEAIAAELGLDSGRVLTGSELDLLADDELDAVLDDVTVFARTTPVQKVRIVEAYQRCGRSVAMTGDGANDAAAIRLADAGIALGGRGTAAARAAADVIVVDDRIETIVDSIAEGRAMWDSVRDAVAILVGGNLGELGFILVGAAITGSSPLNPRQLLLVNLLTDMAPALAIAMREPTGRSSAALMADGPDGSLGGALTRQIAVRAGATASGAAAAWAIARVSGTPTRARTVGLVALVGTQLGQTLVIGRRSPLVVVASGVSMGVLVAVVQTPGVSQFFGCRPLGPVGWTIAVVASAGATGASVFVPWVSVWIVERLGVADAATAIVSRLRAGSASGPGDGQPGHPRRPALPAGA